MASSAGGRVFAAVFVGLATMAVYACAGDRLVLPTFDDSGAPSTSDASCTQCGDECIDPTTDPRHCGGCGTKCASGSACVAGKCSLTCPTGLLNCAGTCLDPTTSAAHCGATGTCDGATAGTTCTAAQTCKNGACVTPAACPAASPDACGTGATALCTNLKTDPGHCGDCATACGAGKVCNNGVCGVVCGALETTCGTGAAATCHTPMGPNDCCGTMCGVDKDCTTGGCAPCMPMTTTTTVNAVPPDPALKVTCQDAAGGNSSTCPLLKCGGITYWVFSYLDNRNSFGVVGYDRNGGVVKPVVEKTGSRYVSAITVNAGAQTVTLVGQIGGGGVPQTVTMPFSDFRLP
jgi:hypothetical protein